MKEGKTKVVGRPWLIREPGATISLLLYEIVSGTPIPQWNCICARGTEHYADDMSIRLEYPRIVC